MTPPDPIAALPGQTLVIAEVAQAHDGSLGTAHSYVDAVADAGADAIKFQTHIARAESTPSEPWRVRFSPQDETRYDYWQRMEFTEEQWSGLREHADARGLSFLSSPFSLEAFELLERVGVAAWKVASGEVPHEQMLRAMARTDRPVLLSSGMSAMDDLDRAVEVIRAEGGEAVVFQCSSVYPCPPESVGLNLLSDFRDRWGCPVGLSDHSGTVYPALAASVLGASYVEVHVTFSRQMFGPDVPASITVDELESLCDGVRFLNAALASNVDKDNAAAGLESMRSLFGRSVVAARTIGAGEVIREDDVVLKKPGSGLPPDRLADVLGRRAACQIEADELIELDQLQ